MRPRKVLASGIVMLASAGVAFAQDVGDEAEDVGEAAGELARETGELAGAVYEETTDSLFGRGLAVMGGFGAETFVSQAADDVSGVGGLWDLRVVMGLQSRIAVELGYIGSAADIDSRLDDSSGTLIGTTIEAGARVHMVRDLALRPYAFAALGWRRYDVSGADFETSSTGLNDADTLFTLPIGLGVTYRFEELGVPGLVAAARGTLRLNMNPDLILIDPLQPQEREFAGMHTWGLTMRAGYEF